MDDFTQMCRVCMSKDKDFQNIFDGYINNSFIHTAIMECAPVQISADDNLPSLICNKCLSDLNTAHSFKKLCAETDTVLRECLNDKFEIKTEIFDDFKRLISKPTISSENDRTREEFENKIDFQKQLFVVITKLPITDTTWNQPPIKTYSCEHCSKIFTDKKSLDQHLLTHIDIVFYECKKCRRVFKSKKSLTIHSKLHLGQRPFVCDICGKDFIRKHHLQKHANVHFEIKPKTEIAERSHVANKPKMFGSEFLKFLESSKNKNKVAVTRRDDVMFQCDLCYSNYKDKNDLSQHLTDVHKQKNDESNNKSVNESVKTSDDCFRSDKVNSEQNTVVYSSSAINKTGKFQCPECGNEYARKHYLKRHYLQKHKEKPSVVEDTDFKVEYLEYDDLKNEDAFLDDNINKNYMGNMSNNIIDYIDPEKLDKKVNPNDEIVEEWKEDTVESLNMNDEPWVMSTYQNGHKFRCKFCDRHYNCKEDVQEHYFNVHKVTDKMQNQSDDTKENAISGDERFFSAVDVDEATKYECNFCDSQFSNKVQAMTHYLNEHETDESVADKDYVTVRVDGIEKLQCKLCDGILKNKYHLKRHHATVHTYCSDKKVFECEACPKVFESNESLRFHVNKHTPFVCVHCNAYFDNRHDLSYHRKHSCEENNLEPCEICGKIFRKRYLVDVHLKYHAGEKLYCCEYCGKTFYTNSDRHRHAKLHSSSTLFRCELCLKTFKRKTRLKNHIWSHTGERPFVCEVCGKTFRLREIFRMHRKIHADEKNFACKFCSKSFATEANMKHHIENVHATINEDERLECEICGKRFISRRYLTLHNVCHADKNERRDTSDLSKCDICGKSVKHLKIHLKYHSRESQYKCPYCEQTYKRNGDLQQHVSSHLGVKKHECHVCSKTFAFSRTLQKHLCVHTGERPYSCDACGKQFIRKDNLNNHSRIHKTE